MGICSGAGMAHGFIARQSSEDSGAEVEENVSETLSAAMHVKISLL